MIDRVSIRLYSLLVQGRDRYSRRNDMNITHQGTLRPREVVAALSKVCIDAGTFLRSHYQSTSCCSGLEWRWGEVNR